MYDLPKLVTSVTIFLDFFCYVQEKSASGEMVFQMLVFLGLGFPHLFASLLMKKNGEQKSNQCSAGHCE